MMIGLAHKAGTTKEKQRLVWKTQKENSSEKNIENAVTLVIYGTSSDL